MRVASLRVLFFTSFSYSSVPLAGANIMGREPLTAWSDTDHSGPIIITTVLGLVYWLVPGIGLLGISFGQRSSLSWASGLYIASMVRTKASHCSHPH